MDGKSAYDQNKFYRGRCRCCLTGGYFRSLTQEYEDNGAKKIFSDMLIACFRLELVPGNSKTDEYLICETCVHRLEDCDKFNKQVKEATNLFEQLKDEMLDRGWSFFDTETLQLRAFTPPAGKCPKDCFSFSDNDMGSADDFGAADDAIDDPDYGWDIVLKKQNEGKRQKKKKKKKKGTKSRKKEKENTKERQSITPVETPGRKKSVGPVNSLNRLPYKLEEGSLKCSDCGEQFYSKIRLSHHMNIHYPNHICHTCGKGFAVKSRLHAHLKSHIKSCFACELCDKVYNSYNSRESHRRHHHGKLTYRCPMCRMRFMNYHARLKHMSQEHGEEEKRHHCKICPGTFSRASHLSTHIKMVHLKEKRVSCETCGAAFFAKSMLDNHMAGHIAKRDHICHICSRSYLRRKTLLYHMKVHKKDEKSADTIKVSDSTMADPHKDNI